MDDTILVRANWPIDLGDRRLESGETAAVEAALAQKLIGSGAAAAVEPEPVPETETPPEPVPEPEPQPETPTPEGGEETDREALILAAMGGLDPANPDHFTKSGKPQVEALEAASGLAEITAAERDAAWAAHQADKEV